MANLSAKAWLSMTNKHIIPTTSNLLRRQFMTKEERAKKWFCNIPDAESISLDTRMNICSKVAKRMTIIFFLLLAIECILLFMLSDGKIFDFMADFLNNISDGSPTRNHYRGMALVGGIACLPIIALPLIVVLIYKNKCLQAEVASFSPTVLT